MLHLGNGRMILKAHIIFILDYEECVKNKASAACIETLSKHAERIYITTDKIKSLIYTQYDNKQILFFSPISTGTLLKRADEDLTDYHEIKNDYGLTVNV